MGVLSIKLGPKSRLLDRDGRQAKLPTMAPRPAALQAPIEFTVTGNPIPWQRVALDTRHPGARPHFVTAGRTRKHQDKIKAAARAIGVRPLDGPVRLTVTFFRETRQRCDVDNLSKSVQDALNGIAYVDDSQIVALVAVKLLDRSDPRTEIRVVSVPTIGAMLGWKESSEPTRHEDHFDGDVPEVS